MLIALICVVSSSDWRRFPFLLCFCTTSLCTISSFAFYLIFSEIWIARSNILVAKRLTVDCRWWKVLAFVTALSCSLLVYLPYYMYILHVKYATISSRASSRASYTSMGAHRNFRRGERALKRPPSRQKRPPPQEFVLAPF